MKTWGWVINPAGRLVEIDMTSWPDLEKKGFRLSSAPQIKEEVKTENQADLNFVAPFQASNGMGRVGEEVLLALDRLGLKINVRPTFVQEVGLQPRTLELLRTKYSPSKKTLFYTIPQELPKYYTEENYLHVPWDTTQAPAVWVKLMNEYCKKVYPCSHFTRETFLKSGVTVPMETIKHGVKPSLFPVMKRSLTDPYTFLTFGDISLRKGTDALITAFQKSFPKKVNNVKLIIKSNHTMDWGQIEMPNDPRIEVIENQSLGHADLLKLMSRSNCFVLPSRAEGFGLPVVEAMATGMPVILNNATALSAFANDKYTYPIESDGTMVPPEWHYPAEYQKDGGIGYWVNPDVKKLSQMMQYVYQRREEADKKGQLAAKWARESWDWDTQVKRMWEDINPQAKTKTWGEFYNKDTLTKNNVQDSVNSHKELFWTILGYQPRKIIETGCGTGEMSAWLSWPNKQIEGKSIGKDTIKSVVALDNDRRVIKIAETNIKTVDGKVKLVEADCWTYDEPADLIFSQGLLEHFSDDQLRALIDHQLEQAPVLVHSVPNSNYTKLDFGNERLMSREQWLEIFKGYDLVIYDYWPINGLKTQSILVFHRKEEAPKVSIIMPVLDQEKMSRDAIEAVRKNTRDYELIVIDDGSNDQGFKDWLDKQADLKVVHIPRNIGVPKCKNLGMALARGEYICFLDNDTIVGEHWLDQLLGVFRDSRVGFTGHEGYMVDFDRMSFLGPKYEAKEQVEWIAGSVFVFPREILRKTGMLIDHDLWCVEDVDICTKIRKMGYIGKLPDEKVNVQHFGSMTAKRFDFSADRFNKWAGKVWTEHGDYLREMRKSATRIDIGVGDAPAIGYTHVDIQAKPHVDVIADARNLPFDDESMEEVRNSHLIEHFRRSEVDALLDEWIRVLKIGGMLRIICPDFRDIARKFVSGQIDTRQALLWTFGGQLDDYDYHYWLYTPESLSELFNKHELGEVEAKHNASGWLEVTGKKVKASPKKDQILATTKKVLEPKIGVYITHVHVYGGGEKLTFEILRMLEDLYPGRVESESSVALQIFPKDFGIKDSDLKGTDKLNHPEIFLNVSHFEVKEPIGVKKNFAFIFYPQYDWQEKLKGFQLITQSKFVARQIKKKWDRDAIVIPDPVNIDNYHVGEKEKLILSVGRFFKVPGGNNKNQEVLIDTFKLLPPGWKLVLVGTVQDQEYFSKLKKQAEGLNIEFLHDIPQSQLTDLFARAKFYWHAAGYGTDEPSSQEHFGLVAVEALASGCQPIVYDGGGMAEINGVITWKEPDHLALKTISLSPNPETVRKFAEEYSMENIRHLWGEAFNA